jgi:hypothetical protein
MRGPIIVTTEFGEQGTSAIEYTYNLGMYYYYFINIFSFFLSNFVIILQAPYLTGIVPDNGPESGGTLVTISGNSLGASIDDIVSVIIDAVPCTEISLITEPENAITCKTGTKVSGNQVEMFFTLEPAFWLVSNFINCFSSSSVQLPGHVIVTTYSGGQSNQNVEFTYNPAPRATLISPNNGPGVGGTLVVIQGTYLGTSDEDVLEVTVAGVSCRGTLVWVSPFSFNCTTSEIDSPSSGPVVVITASGGSGSFANNTIYTYNQAPQVMSITPDSGHALGFTTVTITGSALGKSLSDVIDVAIAGFVIVFFFHSLILLY